MLRRSARRIALQLRAFKHHGVGPPAPVGVHARTCSLMVMHSPLSNSQPNAETKLTARAARGARASTGTERIMPSRMHHSRVWMFDHRIIVHKFIESRPCKVGQRLGARGIDRGLRRNCELASSTATAAFSADRIGGARPDARNSAARSLSPAAAACGSHPKESLLRSVVSARAMLLVCWPLRGDPVEATS